MERRIFARRIRIPFVLVLFDVGVLVALFDSNEDTEKCRSALSIEESDVVDWTSDDEEETINKSSVSFAYKNFCQYAKKFEKYNLHLKIGIEIQSTLVIRPPFARSLGVAL